MTYVEGFVTPVPTANKGAYLAHADRAAAMLKDVGVVRFVEGWGDDVPRGTLTDLWGAVNASEDETVVFSWFEYPDRATRDAASAAMMNDPRFAEMMGDMPFDASRMIYSGFAAVHDERLGDVATGYIDGVVVPLPLAARDRYTQHAATLASVFAEVGAVRVMDAVGDDVIAGEVTDFPRAVRQEEGETVAIGWIEWPDKATRDKGWETLMSGDRLSSTGTPPYDGKRMIFGGFAVLLDR